MKKFIIFLLIFLNCSVNTAFDESQTITTSSTTTSTFASTTSTTTSSTTTTTIKSDKINLRLDMLSMIGSIGNDEIANGGCFTTSCNGYIGGIQYEVYFDRLEGFYKGFIGNSSVNLKVEDSGSYYPSKITGKIGNKSVNISKGMAGHLGKIGSANISINYDPLKSNIKGNGPIESIAIAITLIVYRIQN
tara:strand:+ start:57 stop:626 length:570 start_codon:yes stop_codon:yes gene_type:complete